MGIEQVRDEFRQKGYNLTVLEFDRSSATVGLAANVLGVEPDRIAKTMAFKVHADPLLIVLAGTARIDNRKFRQFFGAKARMLSPEEVRTATGHEVGGVCPFGLPAGIPVYLDVSLRQFDTVYPAAGTPSSAVLVPVSQFQHYVQGEWIDVST